MIDRTLFHAKKIVKLTYDGWRFDIDLLFEGRGYQLTDTPIVIGEDDVRTLIPGVDTDSVEVGDVLTDTVAIENAHQFSSIFGGQLTDDANELLSDVYSGRSWTARILDGSGNISVESSYLSDRFYDMVMPKVSASAPCWLELTFADTTFDDWELSFGEPRTIYSNMHDGMAPLNMGQAVSVLGMFTSVSRFSDREQFRTTVSKQGNSLVLKVTDQCRRMGLDVGDEVDVVMDRSDPVNNTRLRVFDSRRWAPIDDPDSVCHRDGCDLALVKGFLDDFKVIGTVDPGNFTPAFPEEPYFRIFDHASFFKTATGENIIVSQPYVKSIGTDEAEKWAQSNGCTVEEHRDCSWHHPPETTLFVFRRAENPRWRLPSQAPGTA